MRASGDQDVQPGDDRRFQERGGRAGEGPEADQVVQVVGPHDELPHIDVPVVAGDVGDDDVQSAAVRQRRIDERRAQIDPSPGGPQHPLDQVTHLISGEDGVGQLGLPRAGDEYPIGTVDPDLLDLGVIEVALQRPISGDRVEDGFGRSGEIGQGRHTAAHGALVVVGDRVPHQPVDLHGMTGRIEPGSTDEFTNLTLDLTHCVGHHASVPLSLLEANIVIRGIRASRTGTSLWITSAPVGSGRLHIRYAVHPHQGEIPCTFG